MSRSYRKPYCTILGRTVSEHYEKKIASRSWRRLIKRSLRDAEWDSYLVPARREAPYNDRWGWPADGGNQFSIFPDRGNRSCLSDGDIAAYERARRQHEKLKRK